jgi:hypothetical protein
MLISETKRELETTLLSFAWGQWSQMGILADAHGESRWAQDPEALVVFTLQLARVDPRLFDEILDWMATNQHVLSVRRLRALSPDPADSSLTEAALAWVAAQRPKARSSTSVREPQSGLERLYLDDGGFPIRHVDDPFAEYGWARPASVASGKSRPPDLRRPINFAFRLRQLLGTGARAEVVRFLLTNDVPLPTTLAIARSAGYAKRNVQEALNSLAAAGVVVITTLGNEQRYAIGRDGWAAMLELDEFPLHIDWPQLLAGLGKTLRWLRYTAQADLSEYMLGSQARDLLEGVRADFGYAGVIVPSRHTSADALDDFRAILAAALEMLVDADPKAAADGLRESAPVMQSSSSS